MAESSVINPMAKWALAIGNTNTGRSTALFAEINRPRQETLTEFNTMGLPGYNNQLLIPYEDFANSPESAMSQIPTKHCWFQVLPTDGDQGIKLTLVEDGLTHAYAKDRIMEHVTRHRAEKRTLVFLSEFLKNHYGGNISVNSQGELYAEFGQGTQIQYSAGEATPTHFATKKTGEVTRYSFDDMRLRAALWGALRSIPHSDGEFYPGYYEFSLAGDNLRPIFFDYRKSEFYQLGNRPIPMKL